MFTSLSFYKEYDKHFYSFCLDKRDSVDRPISLVKSEFFPYS